jgi:invasion protein IalB
MLRLFVFAALLSMTAGQLDARQKVVATAGDWNIACNKKTSECAIGQNVEQNGQRIASIWGHPVDKGDAVVGLYLSLPANVDLSSGVIISIDGKKPLKYGYHFCEPNFCNVSVGLSQQTLSEYQKGTTGEVSFYLANSPTVRHSFKFSLRGFSSALKEVRKRGYPRN